MFKKIRDFFTRNRTNNNRNTDNENVNENQEQNIEQGFDLENTNIKGYKIKGDNIIVKCGLFKRVKIANTQENIDALNEKLQAQHNSVNVENINNNANRLGKNATTFSILGIGLGLASIFLTPVAPWITIPALVGANACLLGYGYNVIRYYRNISKLNKHDKVEFLNENKDELNEEINYTESDTETKKKLKGVGSRTKNTILKQKHENVDVFDINSINNMSLEGLRQLKRNLEQLNNPVIEDGPRFVLR